MVYKNIYHHLHKTKQKPDSQNKVINFVLVRNRVGHSFPLCAPFLPSNKVGKLLFVAEVPSYLQCIKPAIEGNHYQSHHIYMPKFVTTKISLVSQLFFQQFKAFSEHILCWFMNFPIAFPYQSPSRVNLHLAKEYQLVQEK